MLTDETSFRSAPDVSIPTRVQVRSGEIEYVCRGCGRLLWRGAGSDSLAGVVLGCCHCGARYTVPDAHVEFAG
jgi:hypothetical protein